MYVFVKVCIRIVLKIIKLCLSWAPVFIKIVATQPCFSAFTEGRRRREKSFFRFQQEKAEQSGHLCCLTGSQALGQESGQHGSKGRGTGTITASDQKEIPPIEVWGWGELKTFISWGSLRSTRWEVWKCCCRERTLEVWAGGHTGTMGRPSRGQAGSERVQS